VARQGLRRVSADSCTAGPPKKYEDIVNVDFYATDASGLWAALRAIVLHWASEGIRIFRVDNPHTKPLPFWEWMIADVRALYPDVIFLSEAFTRPKMMYRLAKLGFSQSYTYFTWRNTKQELTDYLAELTTTDAKETLCFGAFSPGYCASSRSSAR
jgi:starch synthase (maltosyl-transferring)